MGWGSRCESTPRECEEGGCAHLSRVCEILLLGLFSLIRSPVAIRLVMSMLR